MLESNFQERLDKFKVRLLQYGDEIALSNAGQRSDEAKRAESFYQGVLSRLYGFDLVNLNYTTGPNGERNTLAAGIDLLNIDKGFAVQITSQRANRSQKIHKSFVKTLERKNSNQPFYAQIRLLLVLFISHDHQGEPAISDDDRQLAKVSDITLQAETISSLLDRLTNLYPKPDKEAVFTALLSAIKFADKYRDPTDGGPPTNSLAHHKKLELGKKFDQKVQSMVAQRPAYYLRRIEHRQGWVDAHPFAVNYTAMNGWPPTTSSGYEPSVSAEALLEQDSLVRYWGIDALFIDNVRSFLNDWETAPGYIGPNSPPILCEIPELHRIELDIYNICRSIAQKIGSLNNLKPQNSYHTPPVISLVIRPCSLAKFDQLSVRANQVYGFIVQTRDYWNKTDASARWAAEAGGHLPYFEKCLRVTRELDALTDALYARVEDHRVVIDYNMGKSTDRDSPIDMEMLGFST
ncbi:SMEK domain-containing protein [Vreelandella populi]|uniref:SMEK domain-containing protein n=1 Tax=Vreelandella populi TaxID=2498858 RepID=UPI000F8E393B|nr:SMEK domain-containing protein [Halomonas populi]RUR56356.1 hypothetical protein ELY40_04145 [Halomonas populi]